MSSKALTEGRVAAIALLVCIEERALVAIAICICEKVPKSGGNGDLDRPRGLLQMAEQVGPMYHEANGSNFGQAQSKYSIPDSSNSAL